MKIHELKILPQYFKEVEENKKTFELRKDDRDYKVGDVLLLKEWNPNETYTTVDDEETHYSGKKVVRIITNILRDIDPAIGISSLDGYAILSIKELEYDVEMEWQSDMIEWGEIYCPFVDKTVMTYYPNGCRAYDSITNPFLSEDGDVYYFKYDHDEGGWCDDCFTMCCDVTDYINLKEVLFY